MSSDDIDRDAATEVAGKADGDELNLLFSDFDDIDDEEYIPMLSSSEEDAESVADAGSVAPDDLIARRTRANCALYYETAHSHLTDDGSENDRDYLRFLQSVRKYVFSIIFS